MVLIILFMVLITLLVSGSKEAIFYVNSSHNFT